MIFLFLALLLGTFWGLFYIFLGVLKQIQARVLGGVRGVNPQAMLSFPEAMLCLFLLEKSLLVTCSGLFFWASKMHG